MIYNAACKTAKDKQHKFREKIEAVLKNNY